MCGIKAAQICLAGRTVLKGYIVTKKSIIQTKLGLLINFSILYMNGAT